MSVTPEMLAETPKSFRARCLQAGAIWTMAFADNVPIDDLGLVPGPHEIGARHACADQANSTAQKGFESGDSNVFRAAPRCRLRDTHLQV